MRSAASLSVTVLRAVETSGVIAPPSTTIPSGAPAAASQGGKRCSSGRISALPSGESPQIASATTPPIRSRQPTRANRVHTSAAPKSASTMRRLDGMAKKPKIFDVTKNIRGKLPAVLPWGKRETDDAPLRHMRPLLMKKISTTAKTSPPDEGQGERGLF